MVNSLSLRPGARRPTLCCCCPGFPGDEEDVLGLGQGLMGAGIAALMFNYRGTYCISLYRLLVQAGAADVRTVAFATDHGLGNVRDERAANLIDWIRATPATTGG